MLDCGGRDTLGRVVDDAGPPVVGVEPVAGEPDGEVDEAPEDAVAPPETPVAVDDPAEPGSPVAADDPAVGPVDGARLDVADPPPDGDVTAAELLGVATTDAGPINCGSAWPPEQAPAASSATASTIPASARNGPRPRAVPARPEVLTRAWRGS